MAYRSHQDELSDNDNPLGSYNSDPSTESGQSSQQSSGGSSYSDSMKNRIRGAENAAAAGKTGLSSAASGGPGKLSGGLAAAAAVAGKAREATDARSKLKDKEGSGLYKPSAKSDDGPVQSFAGGAMRRRLAMAGMMSALVGGGGAFSLFGIVTGPFNIMQVGEIFKAAHLVEKDDQTASRTARLIRNIHYTVTNQSEKTRMGAIGNHFANKVETKMKDKGFTIEYDGNGKYTGYRIDPARLSSADYPDLKDRNPQTVADYFKDKLGADVKPGPNGSVRIDAPGGYFKENRLLKKVLRSTGLRSVSPLTKRVSAVRMNIGLHRYKAIISGQTFDEKYRAWAKERVRTTNWGKKLITAPVAGKDDKGNAATDETTDTVKEINDEIAKNQDDIANNKPGAKSKFTDFLKSKYTGGAASLLGLLCIIDVIASNVDANNYANVIRPAADMGMEAVSLSDQTKDNKDVDSNQMGWWSGMLNDKVLGNWFTARSIQYETGHAMNGTDVGNDMKVDPNGNIATRIVNQFTVIKQLCAVLDGTIGIIITGVMAIFAPIATGIQVFLSLVFGPLIIDWISSMFTADAVNAFVKGALRGGIMNYGVYWFANESSAAAGGINQTKTDETTLKTAARESVQQDFESQNLAYRLFSPTDPKSFIGQVIQTQTPDPVQNTSNLAMGLLNTGKTFGSALGGIFGKTVNAQATAAAPAAYSYGFDDIAFAPSEMNAPEFDVPYENAAKVADILDANTEAEEPTTADGDPNYDNYIVRAKTCFGVEIVKQPVTIEGQADQVQQYTLKPPVTGQVPLQKDVVDKTHKCIDGSPYGAENGLAGGINDWTRIRMFIFDSQTASGMACLEGSEDDPISKQACIDIGIEPDPNGGSGTTAWDSSTGVPTCATTAKTSAPAGYTLASCDDFEGTSLEGSTFTAYDDQGANSTTSGEGRKADMCTVASSFFTLTQSNTGRTCGSSSSFGQQEGYWEVRMRTKAIDGGESTAHPVLILWPDSDVWAEGELDYFETNIGETAGGFLHCIGNPSANCYTIPDGGNEGLTPNAAKYADWLSYGLLWKPDVMTGFIDGQQWWTSTDGSFRPTVSMHQTIQLDNLSGDGSPNPSQMQVDWVHVYCQTTKADCKAAP